MILILLMLHVVKSIFESFINNYFLKSYEHLFAAHFCRKNNHFNFTLYRHLKFFIDILAIAMEVHYKITV